MYGYGDFSRLTFNEADNYAAVWSQQGRIQLESDNNELTAIMLDHLRRLTIDTLGPFAAAYPGRAFEVETLAGIQNDLSVMPGDYYVHGLRCRMLSQDGLNTPQSYRSQAARGSVPPLPAPPFLVELIVWEQTISAMQKPGLLDPALGPFAPDSLRTAIRFTMATSSKLPDGSRVTGNETAVGVSEIFEMHNHSAVPARPVLSARTRAQAEPDDPTGDLPLRRGYRRPENQLYRVEVHTGGTAQPGSRRGSWDTVSKNKDVGQATFKWSRDNGSVQFKLLKLGRSHDSSQITATLADMAHDVRPDIDEGDWVELRDDSWSPLQEPLQVPLPLLQVVSVDRGLGRITLGGPDKYDPVTLDDSMHPYLVRWDQRVDVDTADNAVAIPTADDPVLEEGWLEIEDGVQIRFADPSAVYCAGDSWLIPARSATGGLLWPADGSGKPAAVQATRPLIYRAPLALVKSMDQDGAVDLRNYGRESPFAWAKRPDQPAPSTNRSSDVSDKQPTELMAAPVSGATTAAGGTEAGASTPVQEQPSSGGRDTGDHLLGDRTTVTRPRVAELARGGMANAPEAPVVRLTVQPYSDPGSQDAMEAGWSQELKPGQYSVGRAQGQHIHLTDKSVSSTHAAIRVEPNACRVWDTGTVGRSGSTNGTFLIRGEQETRITTSTLLVHGDVVKFGVVPLLVEYL